MARIVYWVKTPAYKRREVGSMPSGVSHLNLSEVLLHIVSAKRPCLGMAKLADAAARSGGCLETDVWVQVPLSDSMVAEAYDCILFSSCLGSIFISLLNRKHNREFQDS
jgi:hypothetical protein